MYAAARKNSLDEWEWSEPEIYFTGEVGSMNRSEVIDADGNPVVVWQMADFNNIEDDTDLYFDSKQINTYDLEWGDILGIFVLDEPAELDNGATLQSGTTVALTENGKAFVISEASEDCEDFWSAYISYNFEFKKKGFVSSSQIRREMKKVA